LAHVESTCEYSEANNATAPSFKCWPTINPKIRPSDTLRPGKNSGDAEDRGFSEEDDRDYTSWQSCATRIGPTKSWIHPGKGQEEER